MDQELFDKAWKLRCDINDKDGEVRQLRNVASSDNSLSGMIDTIHSIYFGCGENYRTLESIIKEAIKKVVAEYADKEEALMNEMIEEFKRL